MKMEKIAELAEDIVISEKEKDRILLNCKKQYIHNKEKRKSVSVFVLDLVNQNHQF